MPKIFERTLNLFSSQKTKDTLPEFMVSEIKEIINKNHNPSPSSARIDELKFVVMDIETTGFNYKKGDEIIAIGAVFIESGTIIKENTFHQLVYPNRQVPKQIYQLTGIQREMLVGRHSFLGILKQFLNFLGPNIIVGHNIPFDLGFINAKLKKYCRTKIKNQTLDTITIARALHFPSKNLSLDYLLDLYGIEPVSRHTALGDAFLTAELFIRFMTALKELQVNTLGDLEKISKCPIFLSGNDKIF